MVYDCPITKIESVAPHLYGYATYPTINNASFMKNHIDGMPQTRQMTLFFAMCHFSCPEQVFKMLPCQPPDGFITEGLTASIIMAIYLILIFQAWIRILNISWKQFSFMANSEGALQLSIKVQISCKPTKNSTEMPSSVHNI